MIEISQELNMIEMGKRAKEAAFQLAAFSTAQKNAAILAIADALEANTASILAANRRDIAAAEANGTDPVWIRDRIDLERRMKGITGDVRHVAQLPDPVGQIFGENELETGIQIHKVRVPLGVLGVI